MTTVRNAGIISSDQVDSICRLIAADTNVAQWSYLLMIVVWWLWSQLGWQFLSLLSLVARKNHFCQCRAISGQATRKCGFGSFRVFQEFHTKNYVRESRRESHREPQRVTWSLSVSLSGPISRSVSLWLSLYLSLALSVSLWLVLALVSGMDWDWITGWGRVNRSTYGANKKKKKFLHIYV